MLAEYGIFLLKSITVLLVIIIIISVAASAGNKQKKGSKGHIEINKLNRKLKNYKDQLLQATLDKKEYKKLNKQEKKSKKSSASDVANKKVFVLHFKGDVQAQQSDSLREEVSSILSGAGEKDEVVVCLESPGGAVHGYGLAASQLSRIKEKGLNLTVCVDKVAASGGYMMACVADKIMSAPFAIIGSIGVVAQMPNFHKLLKKNDIDFELHTAGDFKRTLTVFGENTDEGRQKFKEDLENIHRLFKEFVKKNRPQLDIDEVAQGEFWLGQDALEKKLVDRICTSDQYLLDLSANADIYEVKYVVKKNVMSKLGVAVSEGTERAVTKLFDRGNWIG